MTCLKFSSFMESTKCANKVQRIIFYPENFSDFLSLHTHNGDKKINPDIQPGKNPGEIKPIEEPDEIEPGKRPDEIEPNDQPDEIQPEIPPEVGPDYLPEHPDNPQPARSSGFQCANL